VEAAAESVDQRVCEGIVRCGVAELDELVTALTHVQATRPRW
jgi:hypothetical protein